MTNHYIIMLHNTHEIKLYNLLFLTIYTKLYSVYTYCIINILISLKSIVLFLVRTFTGFGEHHSSLTIVLLMCVEYYLI